MTTRVLLTDDHDRTLLVECEDTNQINELGAATVFGSHGVSAWVVPDEAVPWSDDLVRRLDELGLREGD
jgi:hypothetical protein